MMKNPEQFSFSKEAELILYTATGFIMADNLELAIRVITKYATIFDNKDQVGICLRGNAQKLLAWISYKANGEENTPRIQNLLDRAFKKFKKLGMSFGMA